MTINSPLFDGGKSYIIQVSRNMSNSQKFLDFLIEFKLNQINLNFDLYCIVVIQFCLLASHVSSTLVTKKKFTVLTVTIILSQNKTELTNSIKIRVN